MLDRLIDYALRIAYVGVVASIAAVLVSIAYRWFGG